MSMNRSRTATRNRTGGPVGAPHFLSRTLCKPKTGDKLTLSGVDYVLAGKIGDGAVGLVRKAKRKPDGKVFAVKFLAPDPKYIEQESFDDVALRFKREGERGARLTHPSLVKIFAFDDNQDGALFRGSGPGNPVLLMEYCSGKTLESYIRRLPADEKGVFRVTKERVSIALQLAKGLEFLHEKKVVHRDVKPANVFLTGHAGPGNVRLGDFGVVKWGDFHASMSTGVLTATNQQGLGTLKYMSPEQAVRPKEVTVRADLYSLGITLFELFTGQILASPHHVFEIMSARLLRGTTISRYMSMGYSIGPTDASIGELLLDMHLRGPSGRPAIAKVRGRLEWELEQFAS